MQRVAAERSLTAHRAERPGIHSEAIWFATVMQNSTQPVREFLIQGITSDGKPFRPSDWAERLCGVMSCFRPDADPQAHLQFSPYVRPVLFNQLKCVLVNAALQDIEPLAYHFVVNFAKDNDLQIMDACLLPGAS